MLIVVYDVIGICLKKIREKQNKQKKVRSPGLLRRIDW